MMLKDLNMPPKGSWWQAKCNAMDEIPGYRAADLFPVQVALPSHAFVLEHYTPLLPIGMLGRHGLYESGLSLRSPTLSTTGTASLGVFAQLT